MDLPKYKREKDDTGGRGWGFIFLTPRDGGGGSFTVVKEQFLLHNDKKKAIEEAIRICIENGNLTEEGVRRYY